MKNRIKRAFNILMGKGEPLSEMPCVVRIIDDNGEEMSDQLGVSRERAEELSFLVEDIIAVAVDPAEVMARVSHECKHPNELALLCYVIGFYIGDKLAHLDDSNIN